MTMTPRLRQFALTAPVTSSVGSLGAVAGFLALAVAGLTSQDAQIVRAAYLATELITWFVIVPLSLASLPNRACPVSGHQRLSAVSSAAGTISLSSGAWANPDAARTRSRSRTTATPFMAPPPPSHRKQNAPARQIGRGVWYGAGGSGYPEGPLVIGRRNSCHTWANS